MKKLTKNISGWGKFPLHNAAVYKPKTIKELQKRIAQGDAIARGNGRSYGDSSISKKNTIEMKNFNQMIEFDDITGTLVAESGVLLKDIIKKFLPLGWFPSVTPGTKFVTVGGMIASDVHGKNHHIVGSFGNFIEWIEIINSQGKIVRCSEHKNSELFVWTIGGMGLTGIITKAAFKLQEVESGWILKQNYATENIQETMSMFEKLCDSAYSVAWLDSTANGKNLGRSIIMTGEHLKKDSVPKKYLKKNAYLLKRNLNIKFDFPAWFLNKISILFFNKIYFLFNKFKNKKEVINWDKFFYPLDRINNWNRIYGKRGFIQFQCVIPMSQSLSGIVEILNTLTKNDCYPFLSVLKRFGRSRSGLSFPEEGYTLTLDFPVNKKNLEIIAVLEEITIKNSGRFYLSKDSTMSERIFASSDVRLREFNIFRSKSLSKKVFSSEQSKRLNI